MPTANSEAARTLTTTTNLGLHDFVLREVLPRHTHTAGDALDLGAGTGLLASRLREMGWTVRAADLNPNGFGADLPFTQVDFNEPDFASRLGEQRYDLVTSVEVIEHVESPIGFLRNIGRLLKPEGVAVLTTPNVDSAPARVKFLLTGKVRTMDEVSEPTHISPIFWDLFVRQFLPRAGLELAGHRLFPPRGFILTRPRYAWAFRLLARILPGDCVTGDNQVIVLRLRKTIV